MRITNKNWWNTGRGKELFENSVILLKKEPL